MEQKRIYLIFLLFGISIAFFISSCNKQVDYSVRSKWIYINTTEHEISYKHVFWSEFDVGAYDTTIFEKEDLGSKNVSTENFSPPLNPSKIYYDNDRCDTLLYNDTPLRSGTSVLGIKNYESRKIGNNNFEFTYRFTDSDYDKSHLCEQDSTGIE